MTLPFANGRQWPDEHFEDLKRHHIAGLSAAQIAKVLNTKFRTAYSRCAVIGQIHRNMTPAERLQRPSAPERLPPASKRFATLSPRPQARAFGPTKVPPIKIAGIGAIYEAADPLAPRYAAGAKAFSPLPGLTPVPFLERHGRQCRWPVGGEGADMACCGGRAPDGEPYCATHTKMAEPPDTKKRTSANELARSLRRYV
jgi:GcrA cell cycle regulator